MKECANKPILSADDFPNEYNGVQLVLYTATDLKDEIMKLIKTETQTFKKGEAYNMADGDLNLPKGEYTKYFECTDEDLDGEWMAMDKCKKHLRQLLKYTLTSSCI